VSTVAGAVSEIEAENELGRAGAGEATVSGSSGSVAGTVPNEPLVSSGGVFPPKIRNGVYKPLLGQLSSDNENRKDGRSK